MSAAECAKLTCFASFSSDSKILCDEKNVGLIKKNANKKIKIHKPHAKRYRTMSNAKRKERSLTDSSFPTDKHVVRHCPHPREQFDNFPLS